MKEGFYKRSFNATLNNGVEVEVESTRFLSLELDELGVINYSITPLNRDVEISFTPYLDAGITNEDTNWDDAFWETLSVSENNDQAFIHSQTLKTNFNVCTFMQSKVLLNDTQVDIDGHVEKQENSIGITYLSKVSKGEKATLQKFAGYVVSTNHKTETLVAAAKKVLEKGITLGYAGLLEMQKDSWAEIWEMADIVIEGDIKAQQGIRFNIFQLNQTYLGKDARLNIGPKGFTGEKYGGSTYWDTEAYCLPFYMATKDHHVARSLLEYRYHHLEKAIENAAKLGFTNGAALYPMVTMNGEECHNEWEITFEEIHRNGAISFAIFNYERYTGDYSYILEKGLEVLIAIARFWHQRATFSNDKGQFVILGVTGPNEYENNVNNNFYTNYIASWSIRYTTAQIKYIEAAHKDDYSRIMTKTHLSKAELSAWNDVASNMYLPFSEKEDVYLQQDGFLDKELVPVSELDKMQRPINQKWSWDRILRSPYIKQADVLQCFYFFEEDFSEEQLTKHFDFYEPFTVHESSLSPCVHSIQAAKLGRMDQAYDMYLRTSRLDLDDYNHEVEEGCHITSMAGTWLSIVEGFGGMRVRNGGLSFTPRIPSAWKRYSFKVNFRGQILKVSVSNTESAFSIERGVDMEIEVNAKKMILTAAKKV